MIMKILLIALLLCVGTGCSAEPAKFYQFSDQVFVDVVASNDLFTIKNPAPCHIVASTNCVVIGEGINITNRQNVLVIKPANAPAREIQLTEAEMKAFQDAILKNR